MEQDFSEKGFTVLMQLTDSLSGHVNISTVKYIKQVFQTPAGIGGQGILLQQLLCQYGHQSVPSNPPLMMQQVTQPHTTLVYISKVISRLCVSTELESGHS